jgi:hypothetical protein
MTAIVILILVLILLAILLSVTPKISETQRVVIFVVLIGLTLLYLLKGIG